MGIDKQALDYFGEFVKSSNKLEPSYLPDFVNKSASFLQKSNPTAPYEALVLLVLTKLAEMASYHKLVVDNGESSVAPINLYFINFLGSSRGKNKPIDDFEKYIMTNYVDEFENKANSFVEDYETRLEMEAEQKYKTKSARIEYVKTNMITQITRVHTRGSYQGVMAQREALGTWGKGGTSLLISELARFLENMSQLDQKFVDFLGQVYDTGDHYPELLKGEKKVKTVKGVASNAIMHTAADGMKEGRLREIFDIHMRDSLARRSFFIYSPKKESSEVLDLVAIAESRLKDLQVNQSDMFGLRMELDKINASKIDLMSFSDEAQSAHMVYRVWCEKRSDLLGNEILSAEMNGRQWKTRKLAGLIGWINHPSSNIVTIDDLMCAIHIAEVCGSHLDNFYGEKQAIESMKIFEFLKARVGKWVCKTDFKSEGWVKPYHFATWFKDNIDDVPVIASKEGYHLEVKTTRNRVDYRLIELDRVDLSKVTISTSEGITEGFEVEEYNWGEIGEVVKSNINYSSSIFKDGYRKKDNYMGSNDVFIGDVDGGIPIQDMIWRLDHLGLSGLIATTRSHNKEKKGVIDERYRVLIPLAYKFKGSAEDYSKFYLSVVAMLGGGLDEACKDASRFFYGNPDSQYMYIEGDSLNPFDVPEKVGEYKVNTDQAQTTFLTRPQFGRNNYLNYILWKYKELGKEELRELALQVNQNFESPLEISEIERTLFKSHKL